MAEPKFCCDCIHWEKIFPVAGDAKGICSEPEVAMKIGIDTFSSFREGGKLWTAAYFGCVHWKKEKSTIINFEKDV